VQHGVVWVDRLSLFRARGFLHPCFHTMLENIS
jgi:hypothetical protein